MKISNETKVGALTTLAITLLILGFNFLKGKSLFKTGTFIYAKFHKTNGILVSNPVTVNGLQVGSVYELEEKDKNLDTIIMSIKLNKDINIPRNSIAVIKDNPLGAASVTLNLGDSKSLLNNHDTIYTLDAPGTLEGVQRQFSPVVDQIKTTVHTLDSVLRNINSIFDPYTKNNMQDVVANINRVTASLVVSSASLQQMMNAQTGALGRSLENLNSFTGNLANNNNKITSTLANLETTTQNLSKADIDGTVSQLKTTISRLNAAVEKMDSKEGSVGKLLNDPQIYDNLANVTRSLNILMDDIRVNPKRYVSISVFGRKDKKQYLTSPLPVKDTTVRR